MAQDTARTLRDSERRRLGARMLATGGSGTAGDREARRSGESGAGRDAQRRRRGGVGDRPAGRGGFSAGDVLPFFAELPERLGSSTALCAAMAGWGIGLALSLVYLEVVRW